MLFTFLLESYIVPYCSFSLFHSQTVFVQELELVSPMQSPRLELFIEFCEDD